ncbi:hypothetical protein [Streptomyces adelaidensis]|uniref:hypothetical protein n=1 Tax=Streptomyces adelaidensis TaxID=2796465 RepID=UPI0019048720|nr:hypothetical protein [Streptomyces adelaidensis]
MTTPGFLPTHVVPPGGLPAWDTPDPSSSTVPLDALLPVRLLDRRGDWGHVLCANGWSAWVDGRLLVAVPQDPPAAGTAPARTADPRPLLARVEEAVARYRTEAEALATGSLDGESFRDRTRGLRIGVVVDGESLWLFDAAHERWVYCDGARLSTFAVADKPHDAPAAPHVPPAAAPAPGPTRVVRESEREGEPGREPGREPADHRAAAERRPAERGPADHEPTRLVPPVTPDG